MKSKEGEIMLPNEIKGMLVGYIENLYSHPDLDSLYWKCGLDIWGHDISPVRYQSKSARVRMLLQTLPPEKDHLLISMIFPQLSETQKIELRRLLEGYTGYTIDSDGNIIPIAEPLHEVAVKKLYLETKLEEIGFTYTLGRLKIAISLYGSNYKTSISVLRESMESLTNDIIDAKGDTRDSNIAENRKKLLTHDILYPCIYRHHDREIDFLDSLYGLLSHYGSHPNEIDPEVASFLFISSINTMAFLVKRFEKSNVPEKLQYRMQD